MIVLQNIGIPTCVIGTEVKWEEKNNLINKRLIENTVKMAAAYLRAVDIPTNFVSTEIMPCVSIGQCCSSLKEEVQASVNELKSMKVAMRTLKEGLKYVSSTNNNLFAENVCDVNPDPRSRQCCNCIHLENQLKESLSELSSVKLIVEIFSDEIKSLKRISSSNPDAVSTDPPVKSSNLQVLSESQHTKEKHNVCASPMSTIYAVPVANRFAPLSNQGEHPVPKDRVPLSATPQQPKFPSSNAYKCIKRS